MPDNGWQNRIVGYGVKRADQFQAHPRNYRKHPKHQRSALAASLKGVGWVDAVTENARTGNLLDGHERIWQALEQGDGTPVPYITVDLSEEEELLVLATFDPITQMAQTDAAMLESLLSDLRQTPMIQADEQLNALLHQVAADANVPYGEFDTPGDPGAQLGRAEELREQWQTARGQVWGIGRHRLMCGDAYSADDIARLLNGETAGMLHTDPPYGINIVKPSGNGSAAAIGGAKPFGSTAPANRKGATAVAFRNSRAERGHVQHGKPSRNQWAKNHPEHLVMRGDTGKVGGGKGDLIRQQNVGRGNPSNIIQSNLYPVIQGDDRPFDPLPFVNVAPIVILWGGNYFADKLPIKACWIVWDKREDITRNNFADCELAWTNMDKPARLFHHLWNGLHKGSQWGERRTHPTEKPVALFAEIGKMFCPDGIWLDLFSGSGTQIVAAEQVGATCAAMEIEPLYIATTLQRLADMGLTPALVDEV